MSYCDILAEGLPISTHQIAFIKSFEMGDFGWFAFLSKIEAVDVLFVGRERWLHIFDRTNEGWWDLIMVNT